MSSDPFEGVSLVELFRAELDGHCAALSDGLLALERNPADASVVEPLMRAAHSIKGAARIFKLDAAVSLAHAMEDVFLGAKRGAEPLTPARVDQLLHGVDTLLELRALEEAAMGAWSTANADRVAGMVAALRAPAPAGPARAVPVPQAPLAPAPSSSPAPAAPAPPTLEPSAANTAAPVAAGPSAAPADAPAGAHAGPSSTVRVAATVLNRMLFLAGESTVEASRFDGLRSLNASARSKERLVDAAVESLRMLANASDGGASARGVLAASVAELGDAIGALQSTRRQQADRLEETLRRTEELSSALYTEVLRSRMRPFSEGVSGFPRMVRDLARQLGKEVELRVEGAGVEVDRDILQKLDAPLTHMVRNGLDHGIETPEERRAAGKPAQGRLTLAARHQSGMLIVEVRDDGRGIDPEAIRRKTVERGMVEAATASKLSTAELMAFPFLPGFSTKQGVSEISGRGVGLDVVQTMVREVSGTVTLESEFGRGTRFVMRLPITRSVVRAALVRIGGQLYAAPLARLHRVALVAQDEIRPIQGRLQFDAGGRSIGLVPASDLLGGTPPPPKSHAHVLIVQGADGEPCGLIVDEVCAEEDLVVRPLDERFGTIPHIASVTIRADGEPVFVLDLDDLARSVEQALGQGRRLGLARNESAVATRRRILVVDDSITVREVERQLLMRRGYAVDVAVDGKDGYNAARAGKYDLIVTDVDMPRMTGIELIRAIRREPRLAELPIIVVSYKDREEDRMAGMDAGASAYLTKSSFHDDSFIRMVEDLIGAPA